MMNHRLQPSPTSSIRESLPLSEPTGAPPAENAKFFRSWLVNDSDLETTRTHGRVNWNTVLGLTMAIVVSACFWAGVGLMIALVWK
jgi:hypothetical protein